MPPPPPLSSLANVPELVEVLRAHAAPIAPPLRSKFFELVDRELGNVREIGPGILTRTCARVQREFVAIPDAARPLDGRR
jgi:hypothetical protein